MFSTSTHSDNSLLSELILNNDANASKVLDDLIRGGATLTQFNKKDEDGDTLLHICCISNNVEIARRLIEFGCDKSAIDACHNTPLQQCLKDEQSSPEMLNLMSNSGFSSKRDRNGNTPIHTAVQYKRLNVMDALYDSQMLELIDLSVDIQRNYDGDTILGVAVKTGDVKVVRKLISILGKNQVLEYYINAGDAKHNISPLHIAVAQKNEDIIKLLISNGCDVNHKNGSDCTPLDIASGEIASFLIENNAMSEFSDQLSQNTENVRSLRRTTSVRSGLSSHGQSLSSNQSLEDAIHNITITSPRPSRDERLQESVGVDGSNHPGDQMSVRLRNDSLRVRRDPMLTQRDRSRSPHENREESSNSRREMLGRRHVAGRGASSRGYLGRL